MKLNFKIQRNPPVKHPWFTNPEPWTYSSYHARIPTSCSALTRLWYMRNPDSTLYLSGSRDNDIANNLTSGSLRLNEHSVSECVPIIRALLFALTNLKLRLFRIHCKRRPTFPPCRTAESKPSTKYVVCQTKYHKILSFNVPIHYQVSFQ